MVSYAGRVPLIRVNTQCSDGPIGSEITPIFCFLFLLNYHDRSQQAWTSIALLIWTGFTGAFSFKWSTTFGLACPDMSFDMHSDWWKNFVMKTKLNITTSRGLRPNVNLLQVWKPPLWRQGCPSIIILLSHLQCERISRGTPYLMHWMRRWGDRCTEVELRKSGSEDSLMEMKKKKKKTFRYQYCSHNDLLSRKC